tara:strand:- start:580 stop:975 length:396 start_codon:yes stop_codon:yes gene_type:complete
MQYLNLEGSISEDWTTEEGPPILGCWVCEKVIMGKQKPSNWTGNKEHLIGQCDRVFCLILSESETLDAQMNRDEFRAENPIVKQWLLCGPKCWGLARDRVQGIIHDSNGHEPIVEVWSDEFHALTDGVLKE